MPRPKSRSVLQRLFSPRHWVDGAGRWLGRGRLAFLLAALVSYQGAGYAVGSDTGQALRVAVQWAGQALARSEVSVLRGLLELFGIHPADAWGNAVGFAHCPQLFPGGQPPRWVPARPGRELCFSHFAVLHDSERKTPIYVVERLSRRTLLQAQGQPRTDRFYADVRLPRAERAELEDYRGSGYARGHMAPAADMPNADAMAQSFSLANMVPQDPTQNAGAWAEVEQATRRYVLRARGDVYVFTGPVYEGRPRRIGPGAVHVPSHLFKLVYDPGTGRSWVHWQANAATAKMTAPISYAEFVQRTGMPLLSAVGGEVLH